MKKHYQGNLKAIEASIEWIFKLYDPTIRALRNSYGYASYGHNGPTLETLASAYFCEDCMYFQDQRLLEIMNGILDYINTKHRPNYTIDMMESNFFTPPLFEAIYMARAYRVIEKYAKRDVDLDFLRRYREYLPKLGYSLINGGVHTPNHRWIGAAAMLMVYDIVKMEKLKEKAFAFLNEGIDMDENGEYTERSPHYNEVCDTSFMNIYLETKDEQYLEYAKKNMDLMFMYIDPDFTAFTANSNRQDRNDTDIYALTKFYYFYYTYMHMSYITKNAQYAFMADRIYQEAMKEYGRGLGLLSIYMLYPELKEYDPVLEPYPENYHFFHKDIVRFRKDDFSVSILQRSPSFLHIQKGALRCRVRICASFFAVAQFKPESIEEIGDKTYQMKMKAYGKYIDPMPTKPPTTVWKEMDHSLRPINNEVDLEYTVTVKIEDDRVKVRVKTEGCDNVPCKIEFCTMAPVDVRYNGMDLVGPVNGNLSVNADQIELKQDKDKLTLTNAFSKHTYHKNMRGSIPPCKDAFTVYYTDFTHIDKEFEIIGG